MRTARAQLLRVIAGLSDEDVRALLEVAERLRAKHAGPVVAPIVPSASSKGLRHPERFGGLAGSVELLGDVESPVSGG